MTDFRELLNIVSELSEDIHHVELHDSFDIELNENFVIETGVIGFTSDGIVLEADESMLELLEINEVILEDANLDERMIIGFPGDQGSKFMGEERMTERVRTTHEDPLVTVHDKDGLNAHANLSTINRIFNIDLAAEDVHKGPVVIRSGRQDGDMLKVELSMHHAGEVEKDREIDEAEYQGRKVQLNKPMQGDVKKSKVYVKGPKGNVVKVNFGDKNMKIKKSNPARRKSFRARHRCDNPGPKWKARYWSCRAW